MTRIAIGARKCEIRDISSENSLVKTFLEENHLQGSCRGNKIALGLFYENELVQLMTFGKPRFNKNFQWEIIRECTKKNFQIIGGSSKLFHYFVKKEVPFSVIVYTSRNIDHSFGYNDHYVKNLGFKRLKNSYMGKNRVWISKNWPRNDFYGKEYSSTSIHHSGPDRILGTKFGFENGTNEEIMRSLGYELKENLEKLPQVDVWFPYYNAKSTTIGSEDIGYIYHCRCSCGRQYVGMSNKINPRDIKNYLGSGKKWVNHIKFHKDHTQFKTIIYSSNNYKSLSEGEVFLIKGSLAGPEKKFFDNLKTSEQGSPCEICGTIGDHKENCPLRKSRHECPECFSKTLGNHKSNCSQKIVYKECEQCGRLQGQHKSDCVYFKKAEECPECGKGRGRHKKHCSLYVIQNECSECLGKNSKHFKNCSHYKEGWRCPECGSIALNHKAFCSKRILHICSECLGGSGQHKKTCSKYKEKLPCLICGAKSGNHLVNCSLFVNRKKCSECGGGSGQHSKQCSKFVQRKACTECGSKSVHKEDCPNAAKRKQCPECGTRNPGYHRVNCSKNRIIEEEN